MTYCKTFKLLICYLTIYLVCPSASISAGETTVGYILDAQGPIAKEYAVGTAIINKTKIHVPVDSKLTLFHNKKCEIIEVSGVTITLRLATYKPNASPSIRHLSNGCAAIYHPKGSNSGIVLRSTKSGRNRNHLKPTFIIQTRNQSVGGDGHSKLELQRIKNHEPPSYYVIFCNNRQNMGKLSKLFNGFCFVLLSLLFLE